MPGGLALLIGVQHKVSISRDQTPKIGDMHDMRETVVSGMSQSEIQYSGSSPCWVGVQFCLTIRLFLGGWSKSRLQGMHSSWCWRGDAWTVGPLVKSGHVCLCPTPMAFKIHDQKVNGQKLWNTGTECCRKGVQRCQVRHARWKEQHSTEIGTIPVCFEHLNIVVIITNTGV